MLRLPKLVTTSWLAANLKNMRVLDASWYMPAESIDPATAHAERRIVGSQRFDIDAISYAALIQFSKFYVYVNVNYL